MAATGDNRVPDGWLISQTVDPEKFRDPPLIHAEDQLRWIREELDAADRTPFGDMGKLLDRMTVAADEALAAIASAALPMKDAPRDGTEILAWHSEGKTWHPVAWVNYPPGFGCWGMRWNDQYAQNDGQFDCWTHMPPAPDAA